MLLERPQISFNEDDENRFNQPWKDDDSSDSMINCQDDVEIENPQLNLVCLLCKQKGEYTVTGRLIPYKLNMYVHVNCALWTNEVFEIEDG